MVLISIRLFAIPRSLFLIAIFLLSLSVASGQTVLLSVGRTPYDRQMERIQPVLVANNENSEGDVRLQTVNRWIHNLRTIPYAYSLQWKTPEEVSTEPVADCKGKAVALYHLMRDHGANGVRLVIGKRAPTSRMTHTWVEWNSPAGTYVLDPTINWAACPLGNIPSEGYTPYYAFAGTRKFRAVTSSGLFARL